jgi:hypothetical protein
MPFRPRYPCMESCRGVGPLLAPGSTTMNIQAGPHLRKMWISLKWTDRESREEIPRHLRIGCDIELPVRVLKVLVTSGALVKLRHGEAAAAVGA